MTYTASAGLKTLVVTKNLNNNFAVTITPFTVGTTSAVTLTGKLIDPTRSAKPIAVDGNSSSGHCHLRPGGDDGDRLQGQGGAGD